MRFYVWYILHLWMSEIWYAVWCKRALYLTKLSQYVKVLYREFQNLLTKLNQQARSTRRRKYREIVFYHNFGIKYTWNCSQFIGLKVRVKKIIQGNFENLNPKVFFWNTLYIKEICISPIYFMISSNILEFSAKHTIYYKPLRLIRTSFIGVIEKSANVAHHAKNKMCG